MRMLLVALGLAACKSDTPAPAETRTSLACAAAIQAPARSKDLPAASPARAQQLDALPGDALLREAKGDELVDPVMRRLSRSLEEPMQMSPPERDLWLVWTYEAEVLNGGHHQFFSNSSGDDAIETRDAIVRIGPPELAQLYACALTAFPADKPDRDRNARNRQLERWGERQSDIFAVLDTAFYDMGSATTPARAAYIRAHFAEMPNAARPLAR